VIFITILRAGVAQWVSRYGPDGPGIESE